MLISNKFKPCKWQVCFSIYEYEKKTYYKTVVLTDQTNVHQNSRTHFHVSIYQFGCKRLTKSHAMSHLVYMSLKTWWTCIAA